jgi:iron complex transport system substrate-binding protein
MIDFARTTTDALNLDALARNAPATDDLPELANWLRDHGHQHLSAIECIELAERLLTRRRFLIGIGALVLAGCTAPGASAPNASAPTTRTFRHFMGETVIPAQPQRIVTLSAFELDWPLLQFGAPLAGTTVRPEALEDLRTLDPEIAERLRSLNLLGAESGVNLELLVETKPDLVIGSWYDDALYTDISSIAPTVMLDYRNETDIVAWQRKLAELAGVSEAGSLFATRLVEYERRISALKQAYPEMWPNLEWTRFNDYVANYNAIYIVDIHPNLPGVKVLTDLGAQPSKTVADFPVSYAEEISLETIAEYDADVIFVSSLEPQPSPVVLPLLQSTFAGQRNQVFTVGQNMWNFSNIQACLAVLDEIERAFAGRTIDTSGAFR